MACKKPLFAFIIDKILKDFAKHFGVYADFCIIGGGFFNSEVIALKHIKNRFKITIIKDFTYKRRGFHIFFTSIYLLGKCLKQSAIKEWNLALKKR